MPLYGCQTPDGYKQTQAAWLNPDAMMLRLSFATALGTGRLPIEMPPPDETSEPGFFTMTAMTPAPAAHNRSTRSIPIGGNDRQSVHPSNRRYGAGGSTSAARRANPGQSRIHAALDRTSAGFKGASKMNRRDFLKTAAALGSAGIVLSGTGAWMTRAFAESENRNRLVVIFLRGAVDGLNVMPPHGEPAYYEARPTIAVAQGQVIRPRRPFRAASRAIIVDPAMARAQPGVRCCVRLARPKSLAFRRPGLHGIRDAGSKEHSRRMDEPAAGGDAWRPSLHRRA